MNILFDISALSVWDSDLAGRRGIHRVVFSLMEALLPLSSLSLSSTEDPSLGYRYVNSRKDLREISYRDNIIQRRLSLLANNCCNFSVNNNRDQAVDRSLSRKISRWSSARIARITRNLATTNSPFDLREINVFHQPGRFEIPTFIQRRVASNFVRFMTIYDFIPFHADAHATQELTYLSQVFSSLSKEDFAICISEYVKDEACERLGLHPERIFVAPIAASKDIFYPCPDQLLREEMRTLLRLGDAPYFLTLCSMEPRKNIKRLISAFADLCLQQPTMDANLVLAGHIDGENAAILLTHIRKFRIENRIILTGYVNDAFLSPLYSDALAFVFPSLSEGFGLPPLEAMQCGTPVVSSSSTSLPEVVGNCGIMFDPNDSNSITSALWEIYGSEPMRNQLKDAGIKQAERFSWNKCADDHLTAYSKALEMVTL